MLKNGTLLKVSPELIQALKNALDLRYLPLIQQASRQRRSLITDDVEPVDTGYNGMFKVIWDNEVDDDGNVTKRRVKVINGAKPTSPYAGDTDIVIQVPAQTVNEDVPDDGTLYLCGRWDDEKGHYYITFTFDLKSISDANFGYYYLAAIHNGVLSQVWTSGVIYFSERYFV